MRTALPIANHAETESQVVAGNWKSKMQWKRVDPAGIHGTQGTLKMGVRMRIFCGCNQITKRVTRKAMKHTALTVIENEFIRVIHRIDSEIIRISKVISDSNTLIRNDVFAPFS